MNRWHAHPGPYLPHDDELSLADRLIVLAILVALFGAAVLAWWHGADREAVLWVAFYAAGLIGLASSAYLYGRYRA